MKIEDFLKSLSNDQNYLNNELVCKIEIIAVLHTTDYGHPMKA